MSTDIQAIYGYPFKIFKMLAIAVSFVCFLSIQNYAYEKHNSMKLNNENIICGDTTFYCMNREKLLLASVQKHDQRINLGKYLFELCKNIISDKSLYSEDFSSFNKITLIVFVKDDGRVCRIEVKGKSKDNLNTVERELIIRLMTDDGKWSIVTRNGSKCHTYYEIPIYFDFFN